MMELPTEQTRVNGRSRSFLRAPGSVKTEAAPPVAAGLHVPIHFCMETPSLDSDASGDGQSAGVGAVGRGDVSVPEPDPLRPGKKTRGKQKINIEFIRDKNKRYTTFSKRKTGLMKKAYELSSLTGAEVMLLVASETNHVYTFATPKLRNMIQSDRGKELIQTCLATDDKPTTSHQPAHQPALVANPPPQPPALQPGPAVDPAVMQMLNSQPSSFILYSLPPMSAGEPDRHGQEPDE